MFKSKIFNSVMRYMLVAMLALLPNTIWGENFTDLAPGYADNNETGQSVYDTDNTFHVSLTNLIYTKLKWATSDEDSKPTGECIYMRMNVVNATTGKLADIRDWKISYGNLYNPTAYDKANYTTSFNYNNYYYNDKYFFFLSNFSFKKHSFDFRITAPIGVDLSQYKVLFYLSNEKPKLESNSVVADPTIKAKVSYELIKASSLSFKHYVGHANTAFDEKGMQQTAEWEYYVYVKDTGDNVELVLPFDKYKYEIGQGEPLEPQGYFRWYDFKTDKANDNLSPVTGTGASTLLKHIVSGGNDYGLFAYNLFPQFPVSKNIGVTYTAPAEASSEDWAGEDIACDVSRYIDGMDASKTYLLHEPTLSIRYIFHIRSAKQLANDIMNTAIGKNPQRAGYRTYEDGMKLTVGMKDKSSTLTLRLDLSDSKKYYFHPLADGVYKQSGSFTGFTHRVYYADDKDKLVESNFDKTKLCNATKIEWWAYDKTKTYCLNLGSKDSRFFDLTMNKLNEKSWTPVSLTGEAKNFTFQYGDPVFIVAYAMDNENHRCPIANFDVRFMNNHPMTKEEITKAGLNNRLISYLDEHYAMATKPITFDDDDVEQTVAAPTTPDDNQDRLQIGRASCRERV